MSAATTTAPAAPTVEDAVTAALADLSAAKGIRERDVQAQERIALAIERLAVENERTQRRIALAIEAATQQLLDIAYSLNARGRE